MNEALTGIDDDCDALIDEDFNGTNSDSDLLVDWEEYHNYSTDYTLWDTDGDGLSDGDEVLNWGSDPLTFDNDSDADPYSWFNDCNDTNAQINPAMNESLNGIDDDCDD